MTYPDILRTIKVEIVRQGFNNYRLAKATGLSIRNIPDLLSGATIPRTDNLIKICEALNLELIVKNKKP